MSLEKKFVWSRKVFGKENVSLNVDKCLFGLPHTKIFHPFFSFD